MKIKLYHGSTEIIKKPKLELGKINNDYGQGFYCTKELEKAKEWASKTKQGFYNEYELDISNLKVLDLCNNKYSALNWIALLLNNRLFKLSNNNTLLNKKFLIKNYLIDITKYDVIIGYRADDSYFRYATLFISNSISLSTLEEALKLGDLGKQIVLISEKAFKKLKYITSEEVDYDDYHTKHQIRDTKARNNLNKLLKKKDYQNEIYIIDIIRGIKNG